MINNNKTNISVPGALIGFNGEIDSVIKLLHDTWEQSDDVSRNSFGGEESFQLFVEDFKLRAKKLLEYLEERNILMSSVITVDEKEIGIFLATRDMPSKKIPFITKFTYNYNESSLDLAVTSICAPFMSMYSVANIMSISEGKKIL